MSLALGYLHNHGTNGMVHRDIKLENVLLGDDNRLKLADFEYACSIDPKTKGVVTNRFTARHPPELLTRPQSLLSSTLNSWDSK